MKNNLTPVTITDKNGRVTTVHRKTDPAQATARKLPALTIPQPADEENRSRVEQARARRARDQANLLFGTAEKVSIKIRLEKAYRELHQETFFTLRMDSHHLESFQIMERLVLRDPLQHHFAEGTYKRYSTLTGATFLKWARLADKHYDALATNPLADENTTGYLPGLFSARICINDRIREEDAPITDEQDFNYLLLNLAAWDSSLEGTRIRQGSGWGALACLENEDIMAFADSCKDPELMQRVCTVIKTQPVTRLQEAISIAEGNTITTLSNGAL